MAYASLKRENFSSGFRIPPGTYKWTNCRFEESGEGTRGGKRVFFMADLVPWDLKKKKAASDETVPYSLGVGKSSEWEPAKGGRYLKAIGQRTTFSDSSNFYYAMYTHAVDKGGLNEDLIDDDAHAFNGIIATHHDVPQPARNFSDDGMMGGDSENKGNQTRMISVIETVHSQPSPGGGSKEKEDEEEEEPKKGNKKPSKEKEKEKEDEGGDEEYDKTDVDEVLKHAAEQVLAEFSELPSSRFRMLVGKKMKEDDVDDDVQNDVLKKLQDKNLKATGKEVGFKFDADSKEVSV